MMKFMDALYDLLKDFQEDEDYGNVAAMNTAIDLWDSFNKPMNPATSVPRLREAMTRNKELDSDGALAYEMTEMLLDEHYPGL